MKTLKIDFYCKDYESVLFDYLNRKVNGSNKFKFKGESDIFGKMYSFGLVKKALFGTRMANYYYDKDDNKVSGFGFSRVKVHGVDVEFKNVEKLSEISYKTDGDKLSLFFNYDSKFYNDSYYIERYNVGDLHQELFDKLQELSVKYISDNGININVLPLEERVNGDIVLVYYDELKNKNGIFNFIK